MTEDQKHKRFCERLTVLCQMYGVEIPPCVIMPMPKEKRTFQFEYRITDYDNVDAVLEYVFIPGEE